MQATWRLREFIRPYWRWALAAPLLMALEVAMDLLLPRLIQRIVDQGISQGDMRLALTTGSWMVIGLAGEWAC